MKKRSTTKQQQDFFSTGARTAVTLPSHVQTEIVRVLCELILEQRRPPTNNTTTNGDEEKSR